jgi:hypothetical protein
MNPKISYTDDDGEIFAIEVDFSMRGYGVHSWRKMRLTPTAAKELATELNRMAAWADHPLYQWAVKKTERNL